MTQALLLSLLAADDAEACGGFACNQARPVLQNAERIVFGLDDERGMVEMHVQITFEGDAEDFAWIVPVPANPDLTVSNSGLFLRLARATQPVFNLRTVEEGYCTDDAFRSGGIVMAAMAESNAAPPMDAAGGTVHVVAEQTVGPYDTVTLQASSTEALLGWLGENGYDLPSNIEEVLAPYVAEDSFFVALKLQKDRDTGDLAPLALRYEATKAIVPVQLTSISATPDMRMEAYVLAQHRAVPESYLHVKINDAAVDWWSFGSNYPDVISQAANEAGGHAFATDYYGEASRAQPIWDEALFDEDRLRSARSGSTFVDALRDPIRIGSAELFEFFEDVLGVEEGNGQLAWQCTDCVGYGEFDADAAVDALLERVVEPMRSSQRLLDRYGRLTRMTSSLDAVEMTVDPVFVLNRDMTDEVRKRRNADLVYECGNGRARSKASRALVLADGRRIELPSENWFSEHGMTEFEYISALGAAKSQVIEQTGAEGPPITLVDRTEEFFAAVWMHNQGVGCNVAGGGGAGTGVLGLGLLAAAARRRRR